MAFILQIAIVAIIAFFVVVALAAVFSGRGKK